MKSKKLVLTICFFVMFAAVNVYGAGVYKRGSRGETVTKIQSVLQSEGLYTGNIDGIYGERTEDAVLRYQAREGLREDGIAGRETLSHMGLISEAESVTENDLYLLSRIISAEARGEPYLGQVAVGAVIMNRVRHPSFPNTIAGVIYQNGAFSALSDGQFDEPISEESRRAARDVLAGVNPVSGAIYYYNPRTATNRWIRSRPVVREIGGHVFCT
ncbi:MAG: spore cortex-lytic enzyme [Oscillospiraceae bacterium]|nr:spore cortex-lytic enzyme [Oscillospiraceae bacterium]